MNLLKSRLFIFFISATSLLFFITSVFSQESSNENKGVVYTITYAKNSKIKPPPLKNITVQIQLYIGGKTVEKVTKKTDQNQSFTVDNLHASKHGSLLVVAVHSVEGESKDMSCYGASLPGKTDIIVDCHLRSEKKHYH